ncbi:hypothetical protein OH76DRAFT_1365678 [Lentinus brumalis]|uniref:CxC2-like cysteine cluster KDZ transposase-associated domain-containing protein n=1 Tax=Lentinus brumalis TaxID=2498619 RepID=A0A371CKI0_9APHY|nr:hypothetical protein OH76DRAFT_1365678 [Polyporus brumalis]
MQAWLPMAGVVLDELVRRDGRGDYRKFERCLSCPDSSTANAASIRCTTCDSGPLECEECVRVRHQRHACHRLQRWNGKFFEVTSLKELGMVIQLGHPDGSKCANPVPAPGDFCAIDVNGHHSLSLNYCGCEKAGEAGTPYEQLLRRDYFPSTLTDPHTVYTTRLLEHYHIQSLQGKMSMYDYYASLERMTDNTGTIKLQDRYKSFMRVVAQWRFLKRLKRAGRAHDPSGIPGTQPGELAVECPACPHPDINLPPNWEEVSDDLQYLYVMSVAIDACFRLKRRQVSSEEKDPILGSGWGYFVEDTGYQTVLAGYGAQDEISTCTGFAAMTQANIKYAKGYAASGVGAVICARHEFMLPNGVGDTQLGEKWINMDYLFVCAMMRHLRVRKLVSYDIACQWSKGLLERIAKFPSHLRIPLPTGTLKYVIPKLHWGAHERKNHSQYSLNYIPGAARLDGEGIERRWWWIQPVANSTKSMGPGRRQGCLEDQWSYANWRKIVDFAEFMRRRFMLARQEATAQKKAFDTFSASFKKKNIEKWEKEISAWEADMTTADPYHIAMTGPSQAQVKQAIAKEEQEKAARPGHIAVHKVSALGFITSGLELEEAKAKLQEQASNQDESKLPALLEQRTAFRVRVQKFHELQAVYTPQVIVLLAQDPAARTDVVEVENVRLGLPSEIQARHRPTACPPDILAIEARLRDADCRDALHDLRTQLHIQDRLYKLKRLHVRHQGPSTRSQTEIKGQNSRIRRAAARYRRTRQGKLALIGPGPWELEFQVLTDNDIRGVQDDDPDNITVRRQKAKNPGPAEGRRTVSWIWRSADAHDEAGYADSVRVEWMKFRSRAKRWLEEERLLPEEMRRILSWFIYQEEKWLCRASQREDVDDALQEGLSAYAFKQAHIRRTMRGNCRQVWFRLVKDTGLEMGAEWAAVEGYVPRKVRRRVNNKIIEDLDEEEAEAAAEEVVEGSEDLEDLEEDPRVAYRRLVELDHVEDLA